MNFLLKGNEKLKECFKQPIKQLRCRALSVIFAAGLIALYMFYKLARFQIPPTLFSIKELLQGNGVRDDRSTPLITLTTLVSFLFVLFKLFCFAQSATRVAQWYLIEHRSNFVKKYGKWACITGATDGIGLSMAKELVRRGHSIVAIGRNETKLAQTRLLLETESNGCEVVTVKIDLSDSSTTNFKSIIEKISPGEREIGILINSAGITADSMKRFHCNKLNEIEGVVNVNALAGIYMTKIVMSGMLKRKRGLILNVSALSSCITLPFVGVYAPTKMFIDSFTQLLQTEYSSSCLDIIYLTLGPVRTKLYLKFAAPILHLLEVSPEAYARSMFNAISVPGIRSLRGILAHEFVGLILNFLHFFDWMPYLMKAEFYYKRMCAEPLFEEVINDSVEIAC